MDELGTEAVLDRIAQPVLPIQIGSVNINVLLWGQANAHGDNLPHRHSFYEVCLVTDGTGAHTDEGRKYHVKAGDLFIARPGVRHFITSKGMTLYWTGFHLDVPDGHTGRTERRFLHLINTKTVVVPSPTGLEANWTALQQLLTTPDPGRAMELTALATALFLGISRGFADEHDVKVQEGVPIAQEQMIRAAVRYIQDNYTQDLTLLQVAQHIGLSSRHLSRLFSSLVGMPFTQYVRRTRLEIAAKRLIEESTPIKEIAQEVNYPDIAYFTRSFKQHFGMPPAAFRVANGVKVQLRNT